MTVERPDATSLGESELVAVPAGDDYSNWSVPVAVQTRCVDMDEVFDADGLGGRLQNLAGARCCCRCCGCCCGHQVRNDACTLYLVDMCLHKWAAGCSNSHHILCLTSSTFW